MNYGVLIVNPKTNRISPIEHNLSRKMAMALIEEIIYQGGKKKEVSYFEHSLDHTDPVNICSGCVAAITEKLKIMDEEAQRASEIGTPAPATTPSQSRPRILDSTSSPPEIP